MTLIASASPTWTVVWSVPRCAATTAASDDSVEGTIGESHRKGTHRRRGVALHRATMVLESMPPERNAPPGTSATTLAATESDDGLDLVGHLGSEPVNGLGPRPRHCFGCGPMAAFSRKDATVGDCTVDQVTGQQLAHTLPYGVRSGGTHVVAKVNATARRFGSAPKPGRARMPSARIRKRRPSPSQP